MGGKSSRVDKWSVSCQVIAQMMILMNSWIFVEETLIYGVTLLPTL